VSSIPGHAFVFRFQGARLGIEGGCNRMTGGFQIGADGKLTVGRMAGTMMACEPALMQADAAMSKLLEAPLAIALSKDEPASLELKTAANETLRFSGERTLESLYGAPTLIFLEVAAQPVACEGAPAGSSGCLQVRERHFDAQGLAVGEPGAFTPFSERIEGYAHRPGERNVLRVKRFRREPPTSGASPFVYVLDLTIESEIVPQ
jgi:hypothetical protein